MLLDRLAGCAVSAHGDEARRGVLDPKALGVALLEELALLQILGIADHRPQLEHGEPLGPPTRPWLAKEDRTLAVELDRDRADGKDRREDDQRRGRDGDVEPSLQELSRPRACGRRQGQEGDPLDVMKLGVSAKDVRIARDEVDLEPGRLQLRAGGGLAGHNGLRSVAQALGSQEFLRLRVGVGRPQRGDPRPVADFVLDPWEAHEEVDGLVTRAADAVEALLADGLEAARQRFNERP